MKLPIVRQIVFLGHNCSLFCDARCEKAWGISNRPKVQLSDDEDDYYYLPDGELGEAPADTGTYEGGHGKPTGPEYRLNKWCARECERSTLVDADDGVVELPDFSKRVYNMRDDNGRLRPAEAGGTTPPGR